MTFRGTMEALPVDAEEQFGITDDEGLSDLRRQEAYIQATSVTGG